MGKRPGNPLSDKEVAQRLACTKRPRGRWANTEERALLDEFKSAAREVLCGPGRERIFRILRGNKVPAEVFLRAFELTANRVGLPVVTQQDIAVKGSSREVVVVAGGLGWPGVAGATDAPVAVDGDHDGRLEQRASTVQ